MSVLNHPIAWSALALVALLSACSGEVQPPPPPPPPPAAGYYVSVETGAAGNPGTEAAPFKRISSALQVAQAGEVVHVLPGIYVDEDFPLQVPAYVNLVGDVASRGAKVVISGGGLQVSENITTAVLLGEGSRFAGFTVINPGDDTSALGVAVAMLEDDATIEHCDLMESDWGLVVGRYSVRHIIKDNRFRRNTEGGLLFDEAGTRALVQDNTATENRIGIYVLRARPDRLEFAHPISGEARAAVRVATAWAETASGTCSSRKRTSRPETISGTTSLQPRPPATSNGTWGTRTRPAPPSGAPSPCRCGCGMERLVRIGDCSCPC